jgi:hypothetical protein
MSIQNAINGQPQAVLKEEVVAVAGTTDIVTVNASYAAFVLELSGIQTTATGKHLILRLKDSGGVALNVMQYAINYFDVIGAATFTNINATGVTDVRISLDLDDAGGTADISLQMFSFNQASRAPAWQGTLAQTFLGPPITSITGLVSGARLGVTERPTTVEVLLDDGTSTFGGVVRVYELIGA